MNELDFIQTVKIQGEGYLLNGIMNIPKVNGNREYELIKQWLEDGNTPEPEFTEEELAQQELQVKLQEAQAYLNSTDWYYARKAETGEDVPVEVVEKRLASRKLIQDNKGAE